MSKPTDIRVTGARLYFIPIQMRIPLKFGTETVTSVTCARACVRVSDRNGRSAEGWGETPLSVQWVWPSKTSYEVRHQTLKDFCVRLAEEWTEFQALGHPIEIGYDFQGQVLPASLEEMNRADNRAGDRMPWLAALVCCSVFDQAIHDAYGNLLQRPVYETYGPEFISRDLAAFIQPAANAKVSFKAKHVGEFLLPQRESRLPAWHLVGGLDLLDPSERTGHEPDDGYPVVLADWIRRDGLKCLKVKLRGNDAEWDFQRMTRVGRIAVEHGVEHLSADFNCTVTEPAYVNDVLDRLRAGHARIFEMLLYVEQPFPYELEEHGIDVRSVASRKPLFLDESAHDWRMIRLGRELGWTGVALKTCKTQTGALLGACWAKAHGMQLMVQDLTNPMLAQIPHVLLAAHVGTIMGVETNAMQFYPEASAPEAAVHPGVYRRHEGMVDLRTVRAAGFGYRLSEIRRELPPAAASFEV
ncbi:MAG TPA: enolase C-terminal domain-like protein [Verrucomicrobiae bacterium]|nr:enolase C-terminal domain-like protein [Verrucomicrobiae bacterium]